jgi:hypothetical protein
LFDCIIARNQKMLKQPIFIAVPYLPLVFALSFAVPPQGAAS